MNTNWPDLPLEEWQDTYATLHMWTQIAGKVQLARTPLVNHWWNIAMHVTPRGLATTSMTAGDRTFQIEFDFIEHHVNIRVDNGAHAAIPLVPRSVAEFYALMMKTLDELHLHTDIWPMPVEVPDPVPFTENHGGAYDPEYAIRFWRILVSVDRVFTEFRSRYLGKVSPVNFYWGSFDMACTRFSGRPAPARDGADAVTREAYSHEVISHGWWPGVRRTGPVDAPNTEMVVHAPAFYMYAAPEPAGTAETAVRPGKAYYSVAQKEFFLLYDDVRLAAAPEVVLLEFMQSTYEAAATAGGWDRVALERA